MVKKTKKKVKSSKAVSVVEVLSSNDQLQLNSQIRMDNLEKASKGRSAGSSFAVVSPRKKKDGLTPSYEGLGDRSKKLHSKSLSFKEMIDGGGELDKWIKDASFTSDTLPDLSSKIKKRVDQETDYINSYYGHFGTILPEYDMNEPYTMMDTEAFLMQAIRRKHSLMFRFGFKVQGESKRFTKYINDRLNQIAYMTGTTVENFVKTVLENLLVISNCFILKIRDEDASGGTPNKKNKERKPIAGYMIIPPHSIFPFINDKGEIIKWRRFYNSARKYKDYKLEDIIHFKWDVKPGHVFGTPRTTPVRDDIFALRRLEENVEMLLINHLFPLFHVKVGNEKAPAVFTVDGISEVDLIKAEIENMPKEGVFVTDERAEIEVVGIKGKAMDPQQMIEHYKARIFTGLGVSALDMGIADGGSQGASESISQNLKDNIKSDLNCFAGQFKMFIIKELFEESAKNLSVQNALLDVSLVFPDVDVDGHIKWQNHVIEMFNNHLITEDEARHELQKISLTKQTAKLTHYNLHVLDLQEKTINLKGKWQLAAAAARDVEAAEVRGGPGKKSVANKNRPANQHGRNLDPHSARSSVDPKLIYDLLLQGKDQLVLDNKLSTTSWAKCVNNIINSYVEKLISDNSDNSELDLAAIEEFQQFAKDRITQTNDVDMISIILQDLYDTFEENTKEVC